MVTAIILEIPEIIGILIGALMFLAIILLLVAIQCCVIIKISNKRHQRLSKIIPRDRLSSTQPYAMVDLRGVEIFKMKILSKNTESLQKQANEITLSQNPSYSSSIKSVARYSCEDGLYVSKEDIRLRDGSYTLEELEKFRGESQFKKNDSVGKSSPLFRINLHDRSDLITPSEHNTPSPRVLASPLCREENDTPVNEQRKRPSEADNGILIQQDKSSRNLPYCDDEYCDDESIYY